MMDDDPPDSRRQQIDQLNERVRLAEEQISALTAHIAIIKADILLIEGAWQHKLISDR